MKASHPLRLALAIPAFLLLAAPVAADVVTDWNLKSTDIIVAANPPTPSAVRALTIVQASVFEVVNAVGKRESTARLELEAAPGASLDAAVAAANRTALEKLFPQQKAAIDQAYESAMAAVPESPAKAAGIQVGQKAAEQMLAMCATDGADADPAYRPATAPGTYVPTLLPAVPQWPKRKPWIMAKPDQFRPAPPPELKSELWTKDFNEIKALGGKSSSKRTAEQTAIATFWAASAPTLYMGVVHSVANQPGRSTAQNARLFAMVTQAMDDAAIAVFDGKYHYSFWRPVTAIRNADNDGNDATERDASWTPFVDTPMHPEYPCAHCIMAATVGTVVQAEVGKGTMPKLSTKSPSAPDVVRSWSNVDDLIKEVSEARIYDGVHYRNSTEVGTAMGRKVGTMVAEHYLKPRP
jgi:PAP2 superfamily